MPWVIRSLSRLARDGAAEHRYVAEYQPLHQHLLRSSQHFGDRYECGSNYSVLTAPSINQVPFLSGSVEVSVGERGLDEIVSVWEAEAAWTQRPGFIAGGLSLLPGAVNCCCWGFQSRLVMEIIDHP